MDSSSRLETLDGAGFARALARISVAATRTPIGGSGAFENLWKWGKASAEMEELRAFGAPPELQTWLATRFADDGAASRAVESILHIALSLWQYESLRPPTDPRPMHELRVRLGAQVRLPGFDTVGSERQIANVLRDVAERIDNVADGKAPVEDLQRAVKALLGQALYRSESKPEEPAQPVGDTVWSGRQVPAGIAQVCTRVLYGGVVAEPALLAEAEQWGKLTPELQAFANDPAPPMTRGWLGRAFALNGHAQRAIESAFITCFAGWRVEPPVGAAHGPMRDLRFHIPLEPLGPADARLQSASAYPLYVRRS